MSPSRLYPSGFRLFRRSRRFSSMSTSTLSMSSGSCWVSSRNFRNRGRNAVTRFFHFTFLSNLMCPLRARILSLRRDTRYLTVFRRRTVRASSASALSRPSPWRARADRPDDRGQRFGRRCRNPGGPEVLRVRWRPRDLRDHVRDGPEHTLLRLDLPDPRGGDPEATPRGPWGLRCARRQDGHALLGRDRSGRGTRASRRRLPARRGSRHGRDGRGPPRASRLRRCPCGPPPRSRHPRDPEPLRSRAAVGHPDLERRIDGGRLTSDPPPRTQSGPRQRRSHERPPRRRLLRRPTNASTSRAAVREEPPRRRLHARRVDGGVPGPRTTPPRGRRIGPPEGRHRVPGVVPSRPWRRNHQFPRGPGLTKPTSRRPADSCLHAYYQRAKDRPQTSSRLTKIQPTADIRIRLGAPCHRIARADPTTARCRDSRFVGGEVDTQSWERRGRHRARGVFTRGWTPRGSHSSRIATCRRSTAS